MASINAITTRAGATEEQVTKQSCVSCPKSTRQMYHSHQLSRSSVTCIQVSLNQLESDHSLPQMTGLSEDKICSPLSLCLNATYLTFEGRVY